MGVESDVDGIELSAAWEKAVVPAEGGTATLLIRIKPAAIEPAGTRRAPVDVAFVLDRSGSMGGEKLALAKQATTTAAGLLRDEDRASLVVYDDEIDTTHALAPATDRAKAALRLALHGIDARGTTNLSGGWLTGCNELASAMTGDRTRLRRALLLSDGQANVGITDPGELMHHAGELRRRGVATSCLGIGQDFDEVLLSGMAEAGGGNFAYIAHANQLPAFFARELGELLTVVAVNLTVSLTMPHGVRATLLSPFPHERHGKRVDVAIGDVAAGRDITLVFDLTIAPAHMGTSHRVVISATWVEPRSDHQREAEVVPPIVTMTQAMLARMAPPNPGVAEEVAAQRADVLQREAMRLDREGRHAESRRRLQEHQALLAAAPQSARVLGLRESMAPLAATEASVPFSEHIRKQVTSDAMRRARGNRDDQEKA